MARQYTYKISCIQSKKTSWVSKMATRNSHSKLIDRNYADNTIDYADSPWKISHDTSTFTFIMRWPITFLLWFTLPDCRKHPRLKMLTFFMCIVWIGITSYTVAMLITIVGKRMNPRVQSSSIYNDTAYTQATRQTYRTRLWD